MIHESRSRIVLVVYVVRWGRHGSGINQLDTGTADVLQPSDVKVRGEVPPEDAKPAAAGPTFVY